MEENQTPIIQTFGITKVYKNKTVLNNVSITVNKGDIYGFVGRNGAGKTTLIRILCNLAFATSGSYKLNGEDEPSKLREIQKHVASMVETPALYLDMSAEDNLRSRCYLLNTPATEEIIRTRLNEVGLEAIIGTKKKVKDFSLGMKQRLGIAMALMGDPEILLLDEPTNGLDPDGIKEVRDLIHKINRERGVTVLVSSHILGELSKLASRFGFIEQGVVVKEISAEELAREEGRYLTLVCGDSQKVYNSLKKKYPDAELVIENDKVHFYHVTNTLEVINFLQFRRHKLIDVYSSENSLEDYFLRLIQEANKNV